MNIPARYCTDYLGDIGVPVSDVPMDFSAWFEATSKATGTPLMHATTSPRISWVLIARGRDAADVAISTTFGPNTLSSFTVITEEITAARSD
jgi:transglutaminase-like putative cysteine protease